MGCPNWVTKSLEETGKALTIDWDYHCDSVTLAYDPSNTQVAELIEAVESLGPYTVERAQPSACSIESRTTSAESILIPPDAPDFFRDALGEARSARLPAVVHFEASWCGACKTMREEVLTDPRICSRLDDGTIVVVSVDADEHPGLARAYGVVSIPDFFFFNSQGQRVDRLSNVEPADAFLKRLEALTR